MLPGEVLDVLRLWRPTPLVRARRLEQMLGTPARIYFKDESGSPAGSHKPNTAVPQAFYNKAEGITRLTTETGAGQWGTALAFACARFDLECKVYMVRASYDGKPYRRSIMETWGASVTPSPSPETNAGRAVLDQDPDSPGSLGIAISEAVEDAATREDTHYSLGSVSNFGGFTFPLLAEKLAGRRSTRVVAVEPTAAPTLTEGRFDYDLGDQAGMTPLIPMYTLGADLIRAVIDEALRCKEEGRSETIVFNLCGHGHFDLKAYEDHLSGNLLDV